MKISILGCGLRTPLLLSGLARSPWLSAEVMLYDLDIDQALLMAHLGSTSEPDSAMPIQVAKTAEEAIAGSDYVICSIRPGGMETRARDERRCLNHGYAGQETVGPAGCAMAWRSIPAVLAYVRIMERLAPQAWLINFTNPAGLVTQAIHDNSNIKAVGICDTPAELFFRIALAFGAPLESVHCEYFGLNHLGFVRSVQINGEEKVLELLHDDAKLASLYPAPLFPAQLIRFLGLIPTEYVFFYYRPSLALAHQQHVGRTRGEELLESNNRFYAAARDAAARDGWPAALAVYVSYLNRRNASYLKLEGGGTSSLMQDDPGWDPFAAVTGYHRIAVQTIEALSGAAPSPMVLNVPNQGHLTGMLDSDVVEINCRVDGEGVHRGTPIDPPGSVQNLLRNTKEYERLVVRAALEQDRQKLVWALTQNPLVGDWDDASQLVAGFLQPA